MSVSQDLTNTWFGAVRYWHICDGLKASGLTFQCATICNLTLV